MSGKRLVDEIADDIFSELNAHEMRELSRLREENKTLSQKFEICDEFRISYKSQLDQLKQENEALLVQSSNRVNKILELEQENEVLKKKLEFCRRQRNELRNTISKHHGLNQAETDYCITKLDLELNKEGAE